MSSIEATLAIIGLIVVGAASLWLTTWMIGKIVWFVPYGKRAYFNKYMNNSLEHRRVVISIFGIKLGSKASIGLIRHRVVEEQKND